MSVSWLFFQEDAVMWQDGKDGMAAVIETWHDEEDELALHDGQTRYLQEGEYAIGWPCGRFETVSGDELSLVDRSFQVGDVCKRRSQDRTDLISGIVIGVSLHVELKCVRTGIKLSEWVESTKISSSACIRVADHVLYNDWVGVVEGVFEEGLLVSEHKARTFKVFNDHVDAAIEYGRPSFSLEGMHDLQTGSCAVQSQIKTAKAKVVSIRQTVVHIAWLAINQKLSSTEQATREKPARLWTDLDQLTVVRPFEAHRYAIGDFVILAEEETRRLEQELPLSTDGQDRAIQVCGTKSHVEVRWQDGSRTLQASTELEELMTIQAHDVWCGDHVIYGDVNGEERGAVVQAMDAREQTATIVLYDGDKESKVVSLLDCKSEGSPSYLHGVNRGDVVLVSATDTHYPAPCVPRLGMTLDYDDTFDDDDVKVNLIEMGREMGIEMPKKQLSNQVKPRVAKDAHEVDWYGVVVDCAMDGQIIVQLPDGRLVEEAVSKLNRLVDGYDEDDEDDEDDEELEDEDDSEDEIDFGNEGAQYTTWTTSDGQSLQDFAWEDVTTDSDGEEQASSIEGEAKRVPGLADSTSLDKFKVLEQAPSDHAFLAKEQVSNQKSFLSYVQREYRILSSSLPDTILVRTYEDRMDLLRAIIVGSKGTPYEDAPFCLDIYLTAAFPSEPPLAHFHSWSQGHGRVSPNLYEDGKVCLSLLNTWQGEQTEAWTPGKSSLLQILLSIQALVLVVEPYFTEPGHERMTQTEVGQHNSQLYSERAYVLSRRFILQALSHGVAGFEEEIGTMYRAEGRLASSVSKARTLVEQETQNASLEGWSAKLTTGGVIALRRVLKELERLHQHSFQKAGEVETSS